MKNVLFFPLLLCILAVACKKEDYPLQERSVNLTDTITIAYSQTVIVEPADVHIKLIEIVEDSRCPEELACLWEGRAVVKLQFEQTDEQVTHELATISSVPEPADTVAIFGYTVKLIEVSPYPVAEEIIPQSDYKVKIVVN